MRIPKHACWIFFVSMIGLAGASGSGLFFGYQAASAKYLAEKAELVEEQKQALEEKERQRVEFERKSFEVQAGFIANLEALRATYPALQRAVLDEVKQEIYSTCIVPMTGQELLRQNVKKANER